MRLRDRRGALLAFVSSLALTVAVVAVVLVATSRRDELHVTTHRFPSDYVGPVWVTVDAPPGEHELVIRWGRWARRVAYRGPGPRTFAFGKSSVDVGPGEPVQVESPIRLRAEFGHGLLRPAGSELLNGGWQESDSTPPAR